MGTCYYVLNVDRMTAFELGKGPWSEAVKFDEYTRCSKWIAKSPPTPESLMVAMTEWHRDVGGPYTEEYRAFVVDHYREWLANNPGDLRFVNDTGTIVTLDANGCAYCWEDAFEKFTITGTRYKTD